MTINQTAHLPGRNGFKFFDKFECTVCHETWCSSSNGAPREIVCSYCTDPEYREHVNEQRNHQYDPEPEEDTSMSLSEAVAEFNS